LSNILSPFKEYNDGDSDKNEYDEKPCSSVILFFCYFMTLKVEVITHIY